MTQAFAMRVPNLVLEPMVRGALLEDMGAYGDATTRAVVPAGTRWRAEMRARQAGRISGMAIAALAFRLVDPDLVVSTIVEDGQACEAGMTVMAIEGDAASILMGERVALNFAGRMSGIATQTAAFVGEAAGTQARITCTRKTTPGLRIAEKLAVLHGGGFNHRYSLSDAILIKDNHIAAAGGVRAVLQAVKSGASHMMAVEIEVDTLDQLAEVLDEGGAHNVLLDNMETATLSEAVRLVDGRMKTEASGNMRLERIAEVAATGVDYISVGALTHSVGVLDLGLDFS
ncbi:carboxylating nicotinate-nucleotide diphosphorylase [Notoacmeibacter ruber]|uniref:Probable nicotinate-nucleotide pyrophosphorylase [carboxylating] n=1 Tax=Notoacmeibacter ruber TaxID=2670375 RepID=A0A3L7JCB3_9HYPH|nr:carboxylating nicotinate-nucleotide diphosphorylase [Notoacmeibacter ruber]RLQ88387.1 carboxylating nicotinate-nucleotide diphosphorylase [Notoacmeibacter ruber]